MLCASVHIHYGKTFLYYRAKTCYEARGVQSVFAVFNSISVVCNEPQFCCQHNSIYRSRHHELRIVRDAINDKPRAHTCAGGGSMMEGCGDLEGRRFDKMKL